ncbi:hypothetical protein AQUCO_02000211v1 [Aquilegia coerulea]|uniref:F-box domain-containing protein n=1 Tax=Aquilegia coerulea TaxID=218851 RepID=A0A2G5DGH3_AQUCA|nr:hypothetical protein AQUCO_02000211v1 [Aquilegia coerulea]
MLPNWSELPEELVSIISEKFNFYEDYLRFSSVCHSWRSVTLNNHKRHSQFLKYFPWLMLPADEDEEEDDHRNFFIPSENKIRRLYLPESCGCHCWGSPYGWLVTLGFDQQFHLLNPLSRARLSLPPLSTFKDRSFTDKYPGHNRMCCVRKAIVSTDENNQVLLVCLIMGGSRRLALARPGDTTWTVVQYSNLHKDVIDFNGQVYTIQSRQIMLCDQVSGSGPTLIHFADFPDGVPGYEQFYLVEFGGNLHLVVRALDDTQTQTQLPPREFHHCIETLYFEVYKLDLSTRKWDEQLETLGDYALFLGSNTSFSLKASDYPECKPGCIYYTDDYDENADRLVGRNMGIYNLETDIFEPLYEGDDILSRFSPPVWITPNPF